MIPLFLIDDEDECDHDQFEGEMACPLCGE